MSLLQKIGRGKRGLVYRIRWKNTHAVLKIPIPTSTAIKRIENEAHWLKRLNAHGIGPTLLDFTTADGERRVMEHIHGEPFEDYVKKSSRRRLREVVLHLFQQCRTMDSLHVNKYEMHKPHKHILVRRHLPILLDFERCTFTLKPKNVTQFAEYLVRLGFLCDRKPLLLALKRYKRTYSDQAYRAIISSFLCTSQKA